MKSLFIICLSVAFKFDLGFLSGHQQVNKPRMIAEIFQDRVDIEEIVHAFALGFLESQEVDQPEAKATEFVIQFNQTTQKMHAMPELDYNLMCELTAHLYSEVCRQGKGEKSFVESFVESKKKGAAEIDKLAKDFVKNQWEDNEKHWKHRNFTILSTDPLVVQGDVVFDENIMFNIMSMVRKLEALPYQRYTSTPLAGTGTTDGSVPHSFVREPRFKPDLEVSPPQPDLRDLELVKVEERQNKKREEKLKAKDNRQREFSGAVDNIWNWEEEEEETPPDEFASLVEQQKKTAEMSDEAKILQSIKTSTMTNHMREGIREFFVIMREMRGLALEDGKEKDKEATAYLTQDFQNWKGTLDGFIKKEFKQMTCKLTTDMWARMCGTDQYSMSCPVQSWGNERLYDRLNIAWGKINARWQTPPELLRFGAEGFLTDQMDKPFGGIPYDGAAYVFTDLQMMSGGDLVFPYLNNGNGLRIKPQRGRTILMFPNSEEKEKAQINPKLAHYFDTVVDGDMWVIRQYFSNNTQILADHAETTKCVDRWSPKRLLYNGEKRLVKEREAIQKTIKDTSLSDEERAKARAQWEQIKFDRPCDRMQNSAVYQTLLNERHTIIESGELPSTLFEEQRHFRPTAAPKEFGKHHMAKEGSGLSVEKTRKKRLATKEAVNVLNAWR